jgi:DNA-binding response OmpR family regulator
VNVLLVVPKVISGFLQAGLSAEGYTVDCSDDIERAIDLVSSNHYDALILDLPIEGRKRIVQLFGGRPRPLIVALMTPSEPRCKEGCADAYLPKPFRFDRLKGILESLTGLAPAQSGR